VSDSKRVTLRRLAGARLLDVTPKRLEALERRIIQAMKLRQLKQARQLLARRLALCDRFEDPRRSGIERVAGIVERAIAAGLDGVPALERQP
jgi:hypothetical protein